MVKTIKNQRGVSLIELLVAVTLFVFIILSATSMFKMVIDGQRNSIAAQNIQENMRYALEKMSKEIRMAKISNHDCDSAFITSPFTADKKVFNTNLNDDILYFKNKDNECVAYYLDSATDSLIIMYSDGVAVRSGSITPNKIIVSNLHFKVHDDAIGAFHSLQPYVTIFMDIKAKGLAMHEQKMSLQATVSSRYYE